MPPWHASTSRMGLEGSGSPNSWLLVAHRVIQHWAFSLQPGSKAEAAPSPMGRDHTSPICPVLCWLLLWDQGSACGLAMLHMCGSCWPHRLAPAAQEQTWGPAPSPKLSSHPGLAKLRLCILPSLRSLRRCFPSCRKCQILDCPGQDRCSALGPQKGGTGGSSGMVVSQLPPFPSLHHCHQKSQSCFIVKQKEMFTAFLFPGQLCLLLSTKHGTEPGTAPACKQSHWAEHTSW